MSVNEDGYCGRCKKWALDFPDLSCPWCHSVSIAELRKQLGLDPTESPIEVLNAVREELQAVRDRQRQLMAIRSIAARALLKRANIPEDIKAAHTKLWAVERWAVADQPQATKERLAPRQIKGKKNGMRIAYEERLKRREEIFNLTAESDAPKHLRAPLGEIE
jgi:hypothetical protein